MPHLDLHRDKEILKAAAKACGLDFVEGGRETPPFQWSPGDPTWIIGRDSSRGLVESHHIMRLSEESRVTLGRPPHQIYVYDAVHHLCLLWEDHPDGFGLLSFFGRKGERLRVCFAIEIAHSNLRKLPWNIRGERVDRRGAVTITYEETMSQKKISVRIAPNGDTTFQTEGYEGTECQQATAALEQALGAVQSDTATEEMHNKPIETEIEQTAGG